MIINDLLPLAIAPVMANFVLENNSNEQEGNTSAAFSSFCSRSKLSIGKIL